ncbi:MAG TPA: hypothetical protein VKB55_02195 [Nocardioidaceae bacterium]|nr:hypothetical protein [Nocardioidaceae bacterium]
MTLRRLVGVLCGALIISGSPAAATTSLDDSATPDRSSGHQRPTIRPGATEDRGVVWRAPARLPTTDARPEFRIGNRLVGYPEVGMDGRTLTLPGVDLTSQERDRLEVWLGSDRLDTPGQRDLPRVSGPSPAVGPTVTPADDPGEPGSHPITTFDYRSKPLPWPAFESPMEVVGHAVLPADVDHAPLVLFLHGRHQACYGKPAVFGVWPCPGKTKPVPSQLGYDYIQRVLASQGYATVSIAANAINAQDWVAPDGGAAARSALVRHHLRLLAQWTDDPARARWFGNLDMSRTVLVGHSRGGEGVDQAVIDTRTGAPYEIQGQTLIGPVDFAYQTAGYTPTVVLLPYCDGDVFDLQGQRYVDAAGTLTSDDPTLRSSVLIRGANHNFFNTEWTPGISQAPSFDDWGDRDDPLCGRDASPTRLTPAEQRRTGRTFVAASVHAFLHHDPAALKWLDSARPVKLPAAGDAVAWTHALGGDRDTVRVGAGAHVTGDAQACRSGTKSRFARTLPLCGLGRYDREVHWTLSYPFWLTPAAPYKQLGLTKQLRMEWATAGATGGLALDAPLDLTGAGTSLDLRLVTDPAQHPTRIAVRLTDGDGTTWTAPDQTVRRLPGDRGQVAVWARTVRIHPSGAPADVDLADIRAIDLIGRSDSGQVWLLDASARRPGLTPPPGKRLPSIRLGDVTVTEGEGGHAAAQLPYTVVGQVTEPGRFAIGMEQSTFGPRARIKYVSITVSPGDTGGVIDVPYEADQIDDKAQQVQHVLAVPITDIAMSDYIGRVLIKDDDPTPKVTLDVRRSPVGYGHDLVFVGRLDHRVDYHAYARLIGVVQDHGAPLRVADVPKRWAKRHLADRAKPHSPLAKWLTDVFVAWRPGEVRDTFVIPTRAHPPHPNPKTLTLRMRSPLLDHPIRATIHVR